jgi:hypothetical protein
MKRKISELLGVPLLLSWAMVTVTVILNGFEWVQHYMEHGQYDLLLYIALLSSWMAACLAMSTGFAIIGNKILGEDAPRLKSKRVSL